MSEVYARSLVASSKLDSRPSKSRKKLLAARERNRLRQRTLSKEDLSRVLETQIERSESRLATAESIAQFFNDLCVAIKNADRIDDEELFTAICKRVIRYLLSDFQCIRAISMRVLRLACTNESSLIVLLNNHVDIFLARSLDLDVENFDERVEALKLSSHLLSLYSQINKGCVPDVASHLLFPHSLILPILAIARTIFATDDDKAVNTKPDGLASASLAVFIEMAISEPDIIIDAAGTGWIVEALAGPIVRNSKISAVLCRMLYTWLDCPRLRAKAKMHMVLEQIFAPLIEIGFFQSSSLFKEVKAAVSPQQIADMLTGFTRSFSIVLSSWSGLLACAASDQSTKTVVSSQLRLLGFLGLGTVVNPNLKRIRGMIVDACCEYLDRPFATKTFDTWIDAVHFYSTMHYPDSFKCSLRDDFVLSEHEVQLASNNRFTDHVDLLASFKAVAIFFLIDAGFAQSLARLILVDPQDAISIKATLLLSDLLLMSSSFLPLEWRSRVLCMPTLIQSACETLTRTNDCCISSTHANINALNESSDAHEGSDYTFINAGNAPLLLHRLDVLNELALSRSTQPIPIGNLELFVQSSPLQRNRSVSLSKFQIDRRDGENGIDSCIHDMIIKSVDPDEQFRWPVVDGVLQLLEMNACASLFRHRHSERCFMFFSQLLHYFKPSSGAFLARFDGDRFSVACGCRAFRVIMPLCAVELRYEQLVQDFLTDFVENLEISKLSRGVFSTKSISNSGAMYFFALIGAISSQECGRKLMERTQLLQTFVGLMTTTASVEYVKLIVSCLDYSVGNSLARVVLQKALTSTNEAARKWSTRFLGVLASHELLNFEDWGMSLLLAQLSDPSPKVVRHAVRLLHRWMPFYPDSVTLLKKVRLDALGDAGVMLKTHLFANEEYVQLNPDDVQMTFNIWRKQFNARYVDIIDEDMKVALLNMKRSLDGRFARISNDRSSRRSVPLPVHFYGQLALHPSGQQILAQSGDIERLLKYLREWPVSVEIDQLRNVKGAILALAHIAGSSSSTALNILPAETVPIICRYAEQCPVLSVRGVAFWAINLIGSTKRGAGLIASLGWESNRHTEVIEEIAVNELNLVKLDDADIWIRCIDGSADEKSFDEGFEKANSADTTTPHPSRHNILNAIADDHNALSSLSFEKPARQRTFTVDSVITSGFGSVPKDSLELCCSTGELNDPERSRITRRRVTGPSGPDNVVVFGTPIDFQKCGELHTSSIIRQKYKLKPFAFSKMQVIQSSVGQPVRYIYMSNNELKAYRQFRNVFTHLGDQRGMIPLECTSTMTVNCGWTIIAVPGQADLLCKDIFPRESNNVHHAVVSSLLNQEKRETTLQIVEKKVHNEKNCFYCSWSEKVFGSKGEMNEKSVKSESRAILLSLVQLMESKYISPEKKLIEMYAAHPELFSSPCIYADVVEILCQYRYRLQTRRFLQELFVDVFYKLANHVMC